MPVQTVSRLCLIYRVLLGMDRETVLSSAKLGKLVNIPAHTIRKDLSVAGIGLLGSSFIKNPVQEGGQFIIVAGFDTNINKIEVMKSDVPLFPAYEMADRIREMRIDLGIIAVPAQAAEMTMQRMKEGGIKGILNFSPAILGDKDIAVRNVHFAEELRFLTAMIPDLEKGV